MATKIANQISSQSNSWPIEDCERGTPASTRRSAHFPLTLAFMAEHPKLLSSREIYKGRVFTLRVDTIQDEGKERKLDIVAHPGSFAIAALPSPGRLVLVQQYRHAAGTALWEIPAGTAEQGEDWEDGARRELREETGYTADTWEQLCSVFPTPGYCTERVHVYAARGLHAGPQALEEDERIDVREVSFEEAWQMQASGEIVDMKTLLALLWLDGGRRK